jgi:hypothetical protein
MTTIFFVVLIGLFGVGGSNVFAPSSATTAASATAV